MDKIKVGITGQRGFLGRHLFNFLGLQKNISIVPFDRFYFENPAKFQSFVVECDVIIHLAALNRHENDEILYDTNVALVKKLVTACKITKSQPHILFSSSTQEAFDNSYGRSKLEGKKILFEWADTSGGRVTSLTMPNIFGPFGKPNYNSVVATFCYKLTHEEQPQVIDDKEIKLIYVNELASEILKVIKGETDAGGRDHNFSNYPVNPTSSMKVSEILTLLTGFRDTYLARGVFPPLEDNWQMAMFNTYRSYIRSDHFPVVYKKNEDERGKFVEVARTDTPGQFSYSTTKPGITRGNHFHTRKVERFAVIKGKARIDLRKVDSKEKISYELDGESPSYVDMPIWCTHNITNIGNEELITLFWINEPFNPDDPDTYFIEV